LFTSAHLDYHRPTDTADRIDGDGLVKVATVAREALDYLVQRAAPLTVTIDASMTTIPLADGSAASAGGATTAAAATPARRVSFGLVPDYAHQGAGVRAESVVPDSPAARAGIAAGDVLLELDGKAVTGLAEFAEMLKAHGPGDSVRALVIRAGARRTVSVELTAR
jgi:S1-C subfamily serine protease